MWMDTFSRHSASRKPDMPDFPLGKCVSVNARRRKCAVHLHTRIKCVGSTQKIFGKTYQCKRSIINEYRTQGCWLFILIIDVCPTRQALSSDFDRRSVTPFIHCLHDYVIKSQDSLCVELTTIVHSWVHFFIILFFQNVRLPQVSGLFAIHNLTV